MKQPFCLFAVVLCLQLTFLPRSYSAETKASRIASAAEAFIRTLEPSQREKVQFEFSDDAQRKRWSNLPTGIFQRRGLRMGDLSPQQREAVWTILAAALSPQGLLKIQQIVEADEVLKQASNSGPRFGKDEYYVSFVGKPSETQPWTIQFGGHHLGMNITLAGDHGTLAPSHTGVQPAIYEIEGKTIRPLGDEIDKAFALLNSLDAGQRQEALIGAQMRDLVLGPGRENEIIQPEGVKGSDLNEHQRDLLLDLVSEWVTIQEEAIAADKMAEIKKNIEQTWFAWSGPTEKGAAPYFRIQGPTVIIEYAPQRLGGDPTKHIHTIYRDPTNEYGKKWW